MNELYVNNKDFMEYVDRYCQKHSISVAQALQHAIVKSVAEYYIKEW